MLSVANLDNLHQRHIFDSIKLKNDNKQKAIIPADVAAKPQNPSVEKKTD